MIIVHRCPDCGDTDLQHTQEQRSYTRAVCRRTRDDLAENTAPEVIPSWQATSKELVNEIREPGTSFGGLFPDRTCACDQCHALYEQAS